MTSEDGGLFSRFVLESSKIIKNKAHHKLFEPSKNGTLSVHTIDGLDSVKIQKVGERTARKRNKTFYGWAKITRALVDEIKLTLCIDNNPYCGHTTISGWPEERNLRLDKQKELASACGNIFHKS